MLARRCCVGKVTLSPQQLQPCPSQTRWHTHPLSLLPPKQAAWAISGTHCHLWGIKPSLPVLGKSPESRSPCVLSFLCAEGTQSILLNHEDGVCGSPKGLFAAPGRNERDPLGPQNGTHSCSVSTGSTAAVTGHPGLQVGGMFPAHGTLKDSGLSGGWGGAGKAVLTAPGMYSP